MRSSCKFAGKEIQAYCALTGLARLSDKCLVIDDQSIVVHANSNHPNNQDAIISSTNTRRRHFTAVYYSIQSKLTNLISVMCKIEKAVCEFVG